MVSIRPLSLWEAILGVIIILISAVICYIGEFNALPTWFKAVYFFAIFYLVVLSEFKP